MQEELPRALTADEMADLTGNDPGAFAARGRAAELIEALTELVAEQAAQAFLDGAELAILQTSLKRTSEAQLSAADALAAANALLADILTSVDEAAAMAFSRLPSRLEDRLRAHLAGQPAAPTRTEAEQLTPEAAWDVLTDYVDVPDRDQAGLFAALQARARRGIR